VEATATGTSSGRGAKFWLVLVACLLGLIFVAANFQKVKIDFIVAESKAPLVIALLITGFLGFVIGLALPRFRRPRDHD
jgi:uncharacterized integral membrane protein